MLRSHRNDSTQKGLLYGVLAFGLWGFGPIYFKAVASVAATEVLAHRIVWSVLFLAVLLTWKKQWGAYSELFRNPRQAKWLLVTALLIAGNWLTFIWAVANDQIIRASLGYFINPLFSVFLGMVFLRERLRPLQWVALALAGIGVANEIFNVGYLPWVAMVLALTFGFYGLVRKHVGADPVQGLTVETVLLLPFALAYLGWLLWAGELSFAHQGMVMDLLLFSAGVVTALPPVYFAAAANLLSLSAVGLLQYIAPSITFLLAIFLYKEPFSGSQLVTFLFLWVALALFTLEGWVTQRRRNRVLAPQPSNP